jgi:hypothetical protein
MHNIVFLVRFLLLIANDLSLMAVRHKRLI